MGDARDYFGPGLADMLRAEEGKGAPVEMVRCECGVYNDRGAAKCRCGKVLLLSAPGAEEL